MSLHLLNKSPFCFSCEAFAFGLSYQCFQISTFPCAADEIIEVITSIEKRLLKLWIKKFAGIIIIFFFFTVFIMVDS